MAFPNPADTEAAFYDAFRDLDIERMRQVWADSTGASCIHPGGELLQGVSAVLASWHEIFRDSHPPRVEHRLIQATSDGRLAVHTVEENVSSGGDRRARVLATNVYRRVEGSWRMLAHHASLPLVESPSRPQRRTPLH